MPQGIIKKEFKGSYVDEISLNGLFLRSTVSNVQKSIANNYVTIKKIFSYTVVQPRVTNVEYMRLDESGLLPLEYTTKEAMYEELVKIISLTSSKDPNSVKFADEIFTIRVKELKYLLANTSSVRLMELNGGYKILEKYLEFIAG